MALINKNDVFIDDTYCIQQVENIINKPSRNKTMLTKLYQIWSNVYGIFDKYNFNYKIIKNNINEAYKYVKDKNKRKMCKSI